MPATQPAPSFEPFNLDDRLLKAVALLGFDAPTPIQAQAIPALLGGRDVIGRARTGSGKTAAFGLPLLERLKDGGKQVRALVLAPTRELALQVTDALRSLVGALPVRVVTLYGGVPYGQQLRALGAGVSVVVGTPGRVLDHLERGTLDLSALELLVLDEADEMLRMGFIDDVERVLAATPAERQVALFSASMPEPIRQIAAKYLREPIEIQVEQQALSTHHITQRWLLVPDAHKPDALARVLAVEPHGATLIFSRTRAGAAEAAAALAARGLSVEALHGDLNQGARELVLTRLRSGRIDIVVATDVAARGLDVEVLSHVINLDLPTDLESYVHRIGRTGRAGRAGIATSLVSPREVGRMRYFERTLGARIEPLVVPSDAEIRGRKLARLREEIAGAFEREPAPELGEMADALSTQGGERAALLAALDVLVRARGLDLDGPADKRPPPWARPHKFPQKSGPKQRFETGRHPPRGAPAGHEVELFLPVGSSRGVRPQDIVGAIAGDAGVPGKAIGRITVEDNKTFVRVPAEIGEDLLREHKTLQLRGRGVPLSRARPGTGSGHPASGPRRPFDAGKPPRFDRPHKPKPFKSHRPKKKPDRG